MGSLFLLFVVLGVYLVSAQATLRVDEYQIEVASLYGRSRISWNEVAGVYMDEQGQSLCFRGADKRLCFSGPASWKRAGQKEMLLYLAARCEGLGLPFETRAKPTYGSSKNARVR